MSLRVEGPLKRVLWIELSERALVRHLMKNKTLSNSDAEFKASSFTRGSMPLKTFYRERQLLSEFDGNQSETELLLHLNQSVAQTKA